MTSTSANRCLLICRQAAWSGETGAFLEIALTAGVFEQHPVLVLLEAAVTLLLPDQHGEMIGMKTLARQIPALELYDISEVLVDSSALAHYGLDPARLPIPVQFLQPGQLAALIATAQHTMVF